MPYILVSTQIRLENGPTNVGDEYSDPDVMNYLGARKTTMLGNNFKRRYNTQVKVLGGAAKPHSQSAHGINPLVLSLVDVWPGTNHAP
uniref:GTP cyclohydrolase 1 feedback regulatory protein n=1 Tax=Hippocampus comes TaxID=109280 RepID=A0A3Q2YNR3_HIPCM